MLALELSPCCALSVDLRQQRLATEHGVRIINCRFLSLFRGRRTTDGMANVPCLLAAAAELYLCKWQEEGAKACIDSFKKRSPALWAGMNFSLSFLSDRPTDRPTATAVLLAAAQWPRPPSLPSSLPSPLPSPLPSTRKLERQIRKFNTAAPPPPPPPPPLCPREQGADRRALDTYR